MGREVRRLAEGRGPHAWDAGAVRRSSSVAGRAQEWLGAAGCGKHGYVWSGNGRSHNVQQQWLSRSGTQERQLYSA